jgi:4-hydroxybenzoate polyprenyltransferase
VLNRRGTDLPSEYGKFTRLTMSRPAGAGLLVACFIALWAVVLSLPVVTVLLVAAAVFGAHYYCWRKGGPLRKRVDTQYDENGFRRSSP